MHKFKTWKQMQAIFSSSSKKESLDSFFKEELPNSRRIVRDVIKEKPIIDLGAYRSNMLRIIMQKSVKKSNTSI
jgi:hypothetical protein